MKFISHNETLPEIFFYDDYSDGPTRYRAVVLTLIEPATATPLPAGLFPMHRIRAVVGLNLLVQVIVLLAGENSSHAFEQ